MQNESLSMLDVLNSSGIAAVFDEGAKCSANMIVTDPIVGGDLAQP